MGKCKVVCTSLSDSTGFFKREKYAIGFSSVRALAKSSDNSGSHCEPQASLERSAEGSQNNDNATPTQFNFKKGEYINAKL